MDAELEKLRAELRQQKQQLNRTSSEISKLYSEKYAQMDAIAALENQIANIEAGNPVDKYLHKYVKCTDEIDDSVLYMYVTYVNVNEDTRVYIRGNCIKVEEFSTEPTSYTSGRFGFESTNGKIDVVSKELFDKFNNEVLAHLYTRDYEEYKED